MLRGVRLFALLPLLMLGIVGYAFAATNTVPVSGAGDGSNTISGYTITNVTYTLNSTTPSNLDKVAFTITPGAGASAPTTVKVQLISGGSWFSCSLVTDWECSVTGITASAANLLRVVAAQ